MNESPDEWLERLFEFEYCPECGGDADDHEVCVVPGSEPTSPAASGLPSPTPPR